MSVAKLARVLDQSAEETCSRILRDHRNGLGPHEETLTQNFVSGYVSRTRTAKLRATTTEFTRWDEARNFGADIALWFTNASREFAGVYLQSKVLREGNIYRGLDHKNSHGRQYDTLISAGRRDRVLAGYAFYNGLRGAEPARSACGHGVGSPEINGISIASALPLGPHIKPTVQRAEIEGLCSPLSCLVRHSSSSTYSSTGGDGFSEGDANGDRGGGNPAGNPGSDLPRALAALAVTWRQGDVRLHTMKSVPKYVQLLAERAHPVPANTELNVTDDVDLDVEAQDHMHSGAEEPRFSEDIDESEFFTAVLVGP